jgi:hypothetical protein
MPRLLGTQRKPSTRQLQGRLVQRTSSGASAASMQQHPKLRHAGALSWPHRRRVKHAGDDSNSSSMPTSAKRCQCFRHISSRNAVSCKCPVCLPNWMSSGHLSVGTRPQKVQSERPCSPQTQPSNGRGARGAPSLSSPKHIVHFQSRCCKDTGSYFKRTVAHIVDMNLTTHFALRLQPCKGYTHELTCNSVPVKLK